jgi:alpha,alpha-trehalase
MTSSQLNPEDLLNELFEAIRKEQIFSDNKDVVDLVPRKQLALIYNEYIKTKHDPNFDFKEFVDKYFNQYDRRASEAPLTAPTKDIRQHIKSMWSILERENKDNKGTLIGLPYPYIVPGGRFDEQFYWDSYFIILGLAADNKWDSIENLIGNFVYMIDKFGFIPNANRTYFLSRSQQPFFSQIIELLENYKGQDILLKYLPYIVKEYQFWMAGVDTIFEANHVAVSRVVEIERGVFLNRYFDNQTKPRPESFGEDIKTANVSQNPDRLYLHLRAAAESGWDFSSRWLDDTQDLSTIRTADIIPVDLNSLLYSTEVTIVRGYNLSNQPEKAAEFLEKAQKRAEAINKYCWDDKSGFFWDYDFYKQQRTNKSSLAAAYPLFVHLATSQQAAAVVKRIENEFLKPGGLVATPNKTGQQWDSPNGWAPLHYITIKSFMAYGYDKLANEIRKRWISTVQLVFRERGKLVEKYDVINPYKPGTSSEYPLQNGFGWTNGVTAALMAENDENANK